MLLSLFPRGSDVGSRGCLGTRDGPDFKLSSYLDVRPRGSSVHDHADSYRQSVLEAVEAPGAFECASIHNTNGNTIREYPTAFHRGAVPLETDDSEPPPMVGNHITLRRLFILG